MCDRSICNPLGWNLMASNPYHVTVERMNTQGKRIGGVTQSLHGKSPDVDSLVRIVIPAKRSASRDPVFGLILILVKARAVATGSLPWQG
ncbi:hypothetical protein IWQ48_004862 [Labrenzia sp. EL_13]|nr:hypothetical protein [Labrenzia sp. EL_13]